MRPVARAGRWAWGLCGLVTAAALAVPGTRLIVLAGVPPAPAEFGSLPQGQSQLTQTRTLTVPQPVTRLNVQSYSPGALIQVTAAPVSHVQVIEMIAYYGRPPAVELSVSGGRPSLADPACADNSCSVSFAVKVPPTVTVTATGGQLSISGISGATLDSDGAPVSATNIRGPLTVSTLGGLLQINGLTGPLHAETGGGQVIATGITAATAVVTTGCGPAQITFSAAPESVTVGTGDGSVCGGSADLTVPGGPYALTANSDGAPQIIGITTSSAARRSITVTTGGGHLVISSGKSRHLRAIASPDRYGPAYPGAP